MKDLLDGIELDVFVSGSVKLELVIDNEYFKELPAGTQVWILKNYEKLSSRVDLCRIHDGPELKPK